MEQGSSSSICSLLCGCVLVRKSLNQALLQVGLGEGPFGSHVSMSVGVSKVSVPQEGFELGGAKKKKKK